MIKREDKMDNDKNYLSESAQKDSCLLASLLAKDCLTYEGEIATLKEKIRTLEQELALYQRKFEFTEPPIQAAEGIRIEELTI